MPAQRVQGRGRARPPLASVVGAGVIVVILAAGFGVMGGRRAPQPTGKVAIGGSAVAGTSGPSAVPTAAPEETAAPLVTPGVQCGSLRQEVPWIYLQVAERQVLGEVHAVDRGEPSAAPMSGGDPAPTAQPRIEIRSDVASILNVVGDACALAWDIGLADGTHSVELDTVRNPERDPNFAQQNRFELPLWPNRGQDWDLIARLDFPEVSVRATWRLRILDFRAPVPKLTAGARTLPLVAGCNVTLSLGSGLQEPVQDCQRLVQAVPSTASVKLGARLAFQFPVDWYVNYPEMHCGQLSEEEFTEDSGVACGYVETREDGAILFDMPRTAGIWAVQISACGSQNLADVTNEVCGDWYAVIQVG